MNATAPRLALLMTLMVSLFPHLTRLPGWVLALAVLALAVRWPSVERRVPLMPKWLLAVMLFAGIAGIRTGYKTWFGPEAGVAFLIFCMLMKLLECRNERDHYVLLVLSLFVLATAFLFEQGLAESLYCLFGVLTATTAMVISNAPQASPSQALRKAAVMLGQAVPLMIILFVFFPRLPPLWSMKLTDGGGRTGMSDSMSPGDLANLGRSDELAFRVEFPRGQTPSKPTLYWRGLTFSQFDGVTWRPSRDYRMTAGGAAWSHESLPDWTETQIRVGNQKPLEYTVILEPSDQPWLYSLPVSLSDTSGVGFTRDFMLIHQSPVFQRLTYTGKKYRVLGLDQELPDWIRQENLSLPEDGNPVARVMARNWRNHYVGEQAYIDALMRWFRKAEFHYTLEPPPLSENRIDAFLFTTRRGFCEHYASSFAFLLRAAGIPARIVAGYQGGRESPTGDSWEVRQMDAHAWVEVWLTGRGWVQFDPTAAVAPERVELGMTAVAGQREVWGNSALSAVRFNNFRLLGEMRKLMDYVNYRWQRDVVGFDSGRQEDFLLRLLGDSSLWRQLGVMLGLLFAVGLLLALALFLKHRRHWHPADRVVMRLSARLARKGLERKPGEGVMAWMERLSQSQPHWQAQAGAFAERYAALRYQPGSDRKTGEIRQLARLLREWPAYRPQKTQLVHSPLAERGDNP